MSVKATSHISGLWTETSRLVENAIFSVSKLKNSTNEEKKNVHTQFYRFKTRGYPSRTIRSVISGTEIRTVIMTKSAVLRP